MIVTIRYGENSISFEDSRLDARQLAELGGLIRETINTGIAMGDVQAMRSFAGRLWMAAERMNRRAVNDGIREFQQMEKMTIGQ